MRETRAWRPTRWSPRAGIRESQICQARERWASPGGGEGWTTTQNQVLEFSQGWLPRSGKVIGPLATVLTRKVTLQPWPSTYTGSA